MAKSRQKSKDRDFVLTIEDDDAVEDREIEKGTDLNPDFSFDLGGPGAAELDDGWDFDIKEPKTRFQQTDPLDDILKRHGGLKESAVTDEPAADEPTADIDLMSEEDEDEDDDEEDESEKEDNDSANDNVNDGGSDVESSDGAEKEEAKTVLSDKSGFFEDAKVDTDPLATFAGMTLSRPVKRGIAELGYSTPTPIQHSVIPVALLGKDIVAGAVTGSGKTAAYMVPTLERLLYRSQRTAATRVIILTPTRELALQVNDVGRKLGKYVSNLRFGLAVGGLNLRAQELELKTRPDIVVATPGRFIDHVRNSPSFTVDTVEVLILDEADRMLEEGFEAELNEILSLIPSKRQTMLFSATMNSSIQTLVKLSLHKPVRIMINPPKQAASGLSQEFVRLRKHEDSRPAVLVSLLRKMSNQERVIVFVARKQTAHQLRVIIGLLGIKVAELHGALSQEQRVESVTAFKSLKVPILICTDLAARGLDIPKIEAVINYELPNTYDIYLHRVGRTARAGRSGTSISLVGDSTGERQIVKAAIAAANTQDKTTARKQTILGRKIDWAEVDAIKTEVDGLKDTISEVLDEEKGAKELALAERDLMKAQNLINHRDEIQSRPKRTWFEDGAAKAAKKPKSNHQKKKLDAGKQSWGYSKTKGDRALNEKRGARRMIMKSGAKAARAKFSKK